MSDGVYTVSRILTDTAKVNGLVLIICLSTRSVSHPVIVGKWVCGAAINHQGVLGKHVLRHLYTI